MGSRKSLDFIRYGLGANPPKPGATPTQTLPAAISWGAPELAKQAARF